MAAITKITSSTVTGCRFEGRREPGRSAGGGPKLGAALYAGWVALVITGIVGGLGLAFQQPWLFPSLGPTIYIHTVTPNQDAARPWNTFVGHGIGAAAAFLSLAVFGALHAAPAMTAGHVSMARIAAIAVPAADPAAKADPDMAKVLGALQALGPKPIESLDASEARKQYSATDAVKKVIKDEKLDVDPHKGLSISNSHFADMGNLRLRYYTPENATKDSNLPVVVYYRGGGWVIADLDTYDASASAIARKANAIVVSVDYPMAPEHKFPAAHDEAIEAYKYILKNARGWGGNPDKVAIVGESAGGNLAIDTAIAARDQKLTAPVAVVSVYPVATTTMDTPSKKEQAAAKPLNTPMMAWFFDKVLNNANEAQDPRLNLVTADLKGLPPVTIINAELDPLRSDGDMLSDKFKAAGNDVTRKLYTGVTHEFFGMDAVVAKAREAQDFAVAQLQKGFAIPSNTVGAGAAK